MDARAAKRSLDTVIKKARVHLYKPIQVAEILYKDRVARDIELKDLETYRTQSRKWRDEVCMRILGRTSTSSARFQDNLFDSNATPPPVLVTLGEINRRYNGAVEAYIYEAFRQKHAQMSKWLDYVRYSDRTSFKLQNFIAGFRRDPGLARSVDKIAEVGTRKVGNKVFLLAFFVPSLNVVSKPSQVCLIRHIFFLLFLKLTHYI